MESRLSLTNRECGLLRSDAFCRSPTTTETYVQNNLFWSKVKSVVLEEVTHHGAH